MPGALFRDIINRVRHNSEKSDSGSSRKVSFNKAVKVKQISERRRPREPADKTHRFNAYKEGEDKPVETPQTPRRRRHLSADSATDQVNMYGPKAYGMGYDLHPSQQPWDPPRVKRNLVRNIVDKFNEEAKRRERLKHFDNDQDDYHYGRPTSPGLIEATPDTAPNHNVPFSYTNGVPPSFLYNRKSKSEHDLKATAQDGEVIYAQVVVNGHATNGTANKTTVHTKVPKKYTTNNNNSLTKNQSVSLGNLHSSMYNGHYEANGDVVGTRTMTQRKFASDEHYARTGAHSSTTHRTKERKVKESRSSSPLREKRRDKWEGNQSKEAGYDNLDGSHSGKDRKKREPSPDYKTEAVKTRGHRNDSPAFREKKKESEHKTKALVREPSPDYNGKNFEESTSSSSKFKERRDFDHGFEEVEQSNNSWSTRRFLNGLSDGNSSSPTSGFINGNSDNGFTSGGSSTNNFGKYRHTERETREEHRSTTRHHVNSSSSSSPTRDSAITNYSERKSKGSKLKNANELQNGNSKSVNGHSNDTEKKFYYFGANRAAFKGQQRSASADKAKTKESALNSTKLVKEANERVNGFSKQEHRTTNHVTSSHKKVETHHHQHRKEGRSSSADRTASSKSKGMNGRIINIEVESAGKSTQAKQHHDVSAFGEDERMETSESDEMHPQVHSTPTRMREYSGSQDSGASNHWSSDEEIVLEDDDEIIAAHVNTPSSMVREIGKQEISYENRQKSQEKSYSGQQMWLERTDVDSDYRKEMSTGSVGEYGTLRNDSNNNYSSSSATLSRLETQRNKINNDVTMRSATVDRRHNKKKLAEANGNQQTSTAVKILLNGRDVSDSELMSGNSRYLSETESQHSGRSKGSRKSAGSSPTSKRVNFKTRSKAKRSASSAANLSPVHREILLRTASPARAPSVTGSVNSSGSEASHASNRSVILHATAVADIPAAKSYRYRIYRDSSPSPSPGRGNSKTVTRSFSLLGPFKPKKYKERYERRYESHHTPPHHRSVQTLPSALKRGQSADRLQTNDSTNSDPTGQGSNNSSAERLDSLSPLPSDGSRPRTKKTVSVTRSQSMPKDTRFGGLFRKKKEHAT